MNVKPTTPPAGDERFLKFLKFLKFLREFERVSGYKTNDADADIKALKVYMSMGHSKQEAKDVFIKAFGETGTPARVNRAKSVLQVSKKYFKLYPYQKDFLASHEILHFEHHRKNKKLRKKITGKRVQEFINYLSDCERSSIKEYVAFLKRDFRFKLWWYNFNFKSSILKFFNARG